MKNIHLHGKAFDDADFKGIIIGGQNQADTLRLVVPKVYGGELDLSSWSWALAYENEKGTGDTVILESKVSTVDSDNLWLDWKPSATATAEKGRLICQLYAYNSTGSKFTTKPFIVYVSEMLDPDPIVTPTPTYIEQALELMAQYNEKLETVKQETSDYADAAKGSEDAAKASEEAAKRSEDAAKTSETNAANSASRASTSESNAKTSETNAANSASRASTSESNAKTSETNAADSASRASTSESNAKTSETNAADSASRASTSESNAKTSEENAGLSEQQIHRYLEAIAELKAQIANLTQAAENAATAAEEAKTGAEQAMADLDRLIGGIPEDFVETNYRINALEACHLEYKDDGVHLIIKQQEEANG